MFVEHAASFSVIENESPWPTSAQSCEFAAWLADGSRKTSATATAASSNIAPSTGSAADRFAQARYFSSQSALNLNARSSFERRVNPCPSSSNTSYTTSRPSVRKRSTI